MSEKPPALIILLHGSPIAESADPVRKMAKVLQGTPEYPNTMLAYLECNEPNLEQAVQICVAGGALTVVVVPYLLHRGKHMVLDVPDAIEAIAVNYPGVKILLGPPVGESEFVSHALYHRIERAAE